jgi:DNA-binding HxlR family transcriptional regulator
MACAMRLIRGRLVEARRCRAGVAEDCRAVSELLSRVGDKCTVLVVWTLGDGPKAERTALSAFGP